MAAHLPAAVGATATVYLSPSQSEVYRPTGELAGVTVSRTVKVVRAPIDFDEVNGAVREVISDGGTDSSATWSQGDDGSVRHSSFTYGLEPAAELELFITRKAALVAVASLPIRLLTRQETLSLRASAGVRINF